MENNQLKFARYAHEFIIDQEMLMDKHMIISHLLNLSILTSAKHDQLLQDNHLAKSLQENQVWVVTQYKININQPWKLSSKIKIVTRLIQVNRFFVVRYFEIFSEDICIMEVNAQFAAIDFVKRSVVRLELEMLNHHHLVDDSISVRFDKLQANHQDQKILSTPILIQASDIDENQHVNNGVYLRWALVTLQRLKDLASDISMIEIKYGKELLMNHKVSMDVYQLNHNEIKMQINNESDQKVACMIKFTMKNMEETHDKFKDS